MPVEFTPDPELADDLGENEVFEFAEEPLQGPEGALDCIGGRAALVEFWLAKLGVDSEGSALTFGEGCSLAILHPVTGKWLTPEQIVKAADSPAKVSRIQ